VEVAAYLMVAGKQRGRKGVGLQYPLQVHSPNNLTFSHEVPYPRSSKLSPQWLLGAFRPKPQYLVYL
jgi:hypothetical protein